MDVIAAYSGGAMPCAIGIVRMSGAGAFDIYKKIFVPNNTRNSIASSHMIYGEVLARDGVALDVCFAVCFRSPRSYTGEDMCEFYCHGSPAVVAELLAVCTQNGARMAAPGEFTKRAFFAGKLDLSRAEAVADLIHSQNLTSARASLCQIKGGVFNQINAIYDKIVALLAHFYAVCDYTDEDIEPWEYSKAAEVLREALLAVNTLVESFERGNIIKNGLPVSIIGKPNVGKSSLLNAILGYERAIVTDEAGTTRDTVDGTVSIGGTLLHLTDTAGMRQAESEAEHLGIERSRLSAQNSTLCLCVLDGTKSVSAEDLSVFELAKQAERCVLIINKCDLGDVVDCEPYHHIFEQVFEVSAKTGYGISSLIQFFSTLVHYDPSDVIITNARHAALLDTAKLHIACAAESAAHSVTADAILIDMEAAVAALGDIVGKSANADVVSEIFSKFCVGK